LKCRGGRDLDFGMNLGGIPGQESPFGFAGGTALVVMAGLLTLVILRLRKML
jgi:Mg2+ and Co2+ transporter CorA